MLRTLLLSAALALVSFGASATDKWYTENDNGGRILLTDEHTLACSGNWFRAHVENLPIEGCFTIGIFSGDAAQKLTIIKWDAQGEEVLVVYPISDFDLVVPNI